MFASRAPNHFVQPFGFSFELVESCYAAADSRADGHPSCHPADDSAGNWNHGPNGCSGSCTGNKTGELCTSDHSLAVRLGEFLRPGVLNRQLGVIERNIAILIGGTVVKI